MPQNTPASDTPALPVLSYSPEKLMSMGSLVAGAASLLKARKAIEKSPAPAAGPAVKAAWERLASPETVLLLGLMEQPQANEAMGSNSAGRRILLGYSEADLRVAAAGLAELGAAFEAYAKTPEFASAAREYSRLFIHDAGKHLVFPLLKVGLRPSTTTWEGQRMAVATASNLAIGIGVGAASASSREEPAFAGSRPTLAAAVGEAKSAGLAPALAAMEALGSTASDHAIALFHQPFDLDPSSRPVQNETQLPAAQILEKALAAVPLDDELRVGAAPYTQYETSQNFATVGAGRASVAVRFVGQGALEALSAAFSSDVSGPDGPLERSARFGLWAPPLSQAAYGPWARQGALCKSIAAMDHIKELSATYNPQRLSSAVPSVSAHLTALSQGPEDIQTALIAQASALVDKTSQKIQASHQKTPSLSGNPLDIQPLDFGAQGAGLSALSERLRAQSPSIGLAQWAAQAMKAIGGASFSSATCNGYYDRFVGERGRAEILAALKAYGKTIKTVEKQFASIALEQAKTAQASWLSRQSFAQAWAQAEAVGPVSGKAMAWALANPVSESLTSADPMARMAAASSRALGISGATDAVLLGRFRAALSEIGCGEEGWRLLEAHERVRDALLEKFRACTAKFKNDVERQEALTRAARAAKSVQASGLVGLDEANACQFIQTVSSSGTRLSGYCDALDPGANPVRVATLEGAQLVADASQAKITALPKLYAALARDWAESVAVSSELGLPESSARTMARDRCSNFCRQLPVGWAIDWRKDPFENTPIWKAMGKPGPRLAPLLAAAASGTPIERWCAQAAARFGILDARDLNDLAAQCRDIAKARAGLTDGAWRIALKSPEALKTLATADDPAAAIHRNPAYTSRKAHEADNISAGAALSHEDIATLSGDIAKSNSSRLGWAATLASSRGIKPEHLDGVFAAMNRRARSAEMLSPWIEAKSVDGADAARFYVEEAGAKRERSAKIFIEACKRFERHDLAWKAAATRDDGQRPPTAAEALDAELADLSDWISGSEAGLWQGLPKDPTWGQLTRLSKQWHDERAARELDRQSMMQAEAVAERETWKADPFKPRPTEHWEPIVGRHAKEGWEAIELTSQSELSDEGNAMGHCVSSYSPYCREGSLRIFSVRFEGLRMCTLEVRPESGSKLHGLPPGSNFRITQNKGKHNASVTSAATLDFCEAVRQQVEYGWDNKHRQTMEYIEAQKKAKRAKKLDDTIAAAQAAIPMPDAPKPPAP